MNKPVNDSIISLMNLLSDVGIHTISHTNMKRVLKNDNEYLSSLRQMLFDCIFYIKHDTVDHTLYETLKTKFGNDLIVLYISEELNLLGYICTENELNQPLDVLLIIGYILAQFILDKIIKMALFKRNLIQIAIPEKGKTDKLLPSFDNDDIGAWTIARHRLKELYKQIESLATSIMKKEERLKKFCPNIDAEILFLMKNESFLPKYIIELKNKNEHLKLIAEWLEQENIFWDWLSSLRENCSVTNLPMESRNTDMLENCKSKLLKLESSSMMLDHLWDGMIKNTDMTIEEVLGEVNANVFIDNESINLHCEPPMPSESQSFISVDNKALQTIDLFNTRYTNKMKKLSKYTDALILDGSM